MDRNEARDAYNLGRSVQFRSKFGKGWIDCERRWGFDVNYEYRLKPVENKEKEMPNKLVSLKDLPAPHVHYYCILAWARGEQIQFYNGYGEWFDTPKHPGWDPDVKYRVKPEIKTIVRTVRVTFEDDAPIIGKVEYTSEDGKLTGVKIV